MVYLFLLISFIVFLFFLFVFAREDHFLMRKGIGTEDMFNISFLGLVVCLLAARTGYVLYHPSWNYLNPLVFFIFWYFPGFSFAFSIWGGIVFLYLYTKRKKLPIGRIYDIIGLAFFPAVVTYLFLSEFNTMLMRKPLSVWNITAAVCYIVFALLISWLFNKGVWRNGIVFNWSLFFFTLVRLITDMIALHNPSKFLLEDSLFIGLWVLSIILIVREIVVGLRRS